MAVARRACVAGMLATAPLLTTAPAVAAGPAAADSATTYFRAQTAATAIHLTVTQDPPTSLVTGSLVDDAVAYATSDFDSSGGSEALASAAFPGRLVTQGPGLLCSEVFSCPVSPPAYPLVADASYPRQPHADATAEGTPLGSGPLAVTPLRAHADAGLTGNRAVTRAGTVRLLAGLPTAVGVEASSATSTVSAAGRVVRVHVQAVANGITLGSLVRIGAVRSVDDLVVRHGRVLTDHPTVRVTGVEVAGHRATVDETGLHVAGADGPSIARRVHRLGITIRTVGVHRQHTRSAGRGQATGLQVDLRLPVRNVPYVPNPLPPLPPPFDQVPTLPGVSADGTYVAHVTFGAVGAVAGAGLDRSVSLGGVGAVPPPPAAAGAAGPVGATAADAATGGDLVHGLAPKTGGAPPAVAPAAPPLLRGLSDTLSRHAIDVLYLVLALGTATLFLGWRTSVFATGRLSRRRP